MARQKSRVRPQNTQANNGTNEDNKESVFKMALTPEQIAQLLSTSRSKGQYNVYLGKFVESGDAGVCANEEWVDLATKKASTVAQGFENAKKNKDAPEGAEFVKVLKNEDKVYLINLKAAGVEIGEPVAA